MVAMTGRTRTVPRRVRMIFSIMANPHRIGILRILNSKGPTTYSELKIKAGFTSKNDSGKFAYHLRKLLRQSLITLNKSEKKYSITNLGKLIVSLAKQIEERSVIESGRMYVRLSQGMMEEFNPHKITQSLVREGGLSLDLARKITEEAEILIYRYQITRLTGPLIRDVANSLLLEYGYEEYRNKLARMGLPAHSIHEVLSTESYADEAGSEDLLIKAGRSVYEEFLITNNLFKDVADFHLAGDLHIANHGLWFLLPDTVFFDLNKMVSGGIDIDHKLNYIPQMPAAQSLDGLTTLISMHLSLSFREATREVVLDGLAPLLFPYYKQPSDMREKLVSAFATASVSNSSRGQAAVSFRIKTGESLEINDVILDAYKRYVEITKYPRINLVVDYSDGKVASISSRLAAIISSGGNIAFAKGPVSYNGIANATRNNLPSVQMDSVSINLPRLALESNNDEVYFRANLATLMEPVLESMIIRRRYVTDLIRKGLGPLLTKSTSHMQQGSVSMSLNLVGLSEASTILGEQDESELLKSTTSTAAKVADKKSKKSGGDIRVCMVEGGGAARLLSLDAAKFGRISLQNVITGDSSYSEGISIDASDIYAAGSLAARRHEEIAQVLSGGLVTFVDIKPNSSQTMIESAIIDATKSLSFFRPRLRPDIP